MGNWGQISQNAGQYAGVASTIAGGYLQASMSRKEGAAQQQLAIYNAAQYEQDAKNVQIDAQQAALGTRKQGRAIEGTQRALYASSGILTSEGTPLAVMADTAAQIEIQALRQERSAAAEAIRLRNQANNMVAEGRMANTAGKQRAFATILSTGTKAYSQYRDINKVTPKK